MRRISFMAVFLCILSLLTGCTEEEPSQNTVSKEGFYFNTIIEISVPEEHEELLDGAFEVCEKIEETFSRTRTDSELYRINHRTESEVTVSDWMREVLETGLTFYELTDGALDITIAPVLDLWNFTGDDPHVPD